MSQSIHQRIPRHLSRREKKKLQQKKNLYHQRIFDVVKQRLGNEQRLRDIHKKNHEERIKAIRREKERKDQKEEIWSVKVLKIRNRLHGRKRDSEDRWNRFAGTSDGGGRGR